MQIHKYSQANQDYLTFDELLLPTDDLMRDFIFTLCVFVLHSSKFMGSTPCYGFHMRLNRKTNLFLRFLHRSFIILNIFKLPIIFSFTTRSEEIFRFCSFSSFVNGFFLLDFFGYLCIVL